MSRPLEKKLAIVTGASRGIGAAIAENLASKGCSLVLNYTSPSSKSSTEQLAGELASRYGIHTLALQADMATLDAPAALVQAAKRHFSTSDSVVPFQIDILIHNAGVALNNRIEDINPEDFDKSYYVNVRGPLLLTKACEPYLPRDRSGRIVTLSSVSSSLGLLGQSIYGGTKAALEAMTRTWARELSERCTSNAVNPGPVLTSMYAGNTPEFKEAMRPFIEHSPLMQVRDGIDDAELVADAKVSGGRPAYCNEIAGVVAMLCTQDASWCTGQVICANGGMIFGMQ